VRIVSGGVTDVGRVRTNNEDCFRIVESLDLFVLADGMGGEAHGEVASALAVETIVKSCMDPGVDAGATLVGNSEPTWSEKTKRLTSAVHRANKNIYDAAEANPEQHGMGATLTAAWIDGSKLSIAHVGDSRAYLLRSGNLQQLTSDHSLVAEQVRRGILTAAEAEESEMQSVLLRALGALPDIEVDTDEHVLFARDIVMLCCDGLTRMVTEPDWNPPRVVRYEDRYYRLEDYARGSGPRPFVYRLRRLAAGVPGRTVLVYSPDEAPITANR